MNTATAHRRSPFLRGQARHWLGLGVLMLVLAGTANAADGSIKHGMIMRGHILEAEAGALVICVGEKDGAQVGQELDVVSHQRVTGTPKKAGPRYREYIGPQGYRPGEGKADSWFYKPENRRRYFGGFASFFKASAALWSLVCSSCQAVPPSVPIGSGGASGPSGWSRLNIAPCGSAQTAIRPTCGIGGRT